MSLPLLLATLTEMSRAGAWILTYKALKVCSRVFFAVLEREAFYSV